MGDSSSPADRALLHDLPATYLQRSDAILKRIFANYGDFDFAVRLWDGSYSILPSKGRPRFTLVIRHPGALRRMFLPPTELNLGEAFIFDDFDIEGDIIAAAGLMDYIPDAGLSAGDIVWLVGQLLALPRGYTSETMRPGLRPTGLRHSRWRDRQAVQFHYDVSNEFYALWLDETMTYSCAYFRTGEEDIHTAQRQKLEHICRKLQLRPGERLLDIGCGWGGLLIHAAREYGVDATGITLSEKQAALARERIAEAGLSDRCRVLLMDYREVPTDQPFDKLVSVGMFEHVGAAKLPLYFEQAWRLLRPGGLFLNHGIASMSSHVGQRKTFGQWLFRRNSFMDRYVFPDGELVDIHQTLQAAEGVGFEVRDVESLREHYALTLRHWVRRLEEHHEEALQYVDEPTFRVWRIYMAGCSHGFARSRINVYQALLSKNDVRGQSHQPWTREYMYRM
ncbi:MAG TPA: class I SAM-dependent methyltransferase [Chloroflexi bacterium]|nr:class I SAM-dependent methyltransferase [Chloroflexota bacterium]